MKNKQSLISHKLEMEKFKIKNWLLAAAVALVSFTAGGIVLDKAKAQDTTTRYPPLVEKLMEKFGLKEEEVKSVFEEVRQERQQQRQKFIETRLDEAVKDGVITAEQKQALLNKNAEMQEKQRQMNEERRKWMEESGIDFEKLAPYRVGFGGRGFRQGHGFRGF